MNPPRTSSLWLATSASAGLSRSVGRNSCEARTITVASAGYSLIGTSEASAMATSLAMSLKRSRDSLPRPLNPVTRRLFEWDQRRLCHGQSRGLRHFQSLGPVHAVDDPLIDRVEELVDEDVGRDLLQDAAVGVDEADVPAARDAEVCVARLPRSVDRAAEHCDLEVLRVGVQALLDLLGEGLDADVVPPAARAGDHDRPPLAQA